MRIDRKAIEEITGRKRVSSQVTWFRKHLGVDVPSDRFGPILTAQTYEKLLEKRLGLAHTPVEPLTTKPSVRLLKAR